MISNFDDFIESLKDYYIEMGFQAEIISDVNGSVVFQLRDRESQAIDKGQGTTQLEICKGQGTKNEGESVMTTNRELSDIVVDELCVQILAHFDFDHLPENLQKVSKMFHHLAWTMYENTFPTSIEKYECLRKLLEAKDCAVRAAL